MRVGVEVGGTFTDLVAVEGGRVVVTSKEVLVDPRPGGAEPMLLRRTPGAQGAR